MSNDERVVDPEKMKAEEQQEAAVNPAGPGGEDPTGEPGAAALEDALAKADQYYKSWQRAAADFANFKRRVETERAESARFASAAVVINLLPVYDDFERAAGTVDAQLAGLNWVQGVLAIQRKFWHMLEAMGVAEVPAEGQAFDPALHEAVARQPGDEGKVLHVVQKGYKLGERVVRPAMVIVGEGG